MWGCVSFPKIISGRIGGAVQPGWEWWQWRQSVGPLDAKAHLSLMPSGCRIGGKNSPQVRLAEDEYLIQALAAQCAGSDVRHNHSATAPTSPNPGATRVAIN